MSAPGGIEVQGLSKAYAPPFRRGRTAAGPAPLALADLTFRVAPGELVAVIGPNGAGKSTLLRVLAGLLTPTAGTARVHGCDVVKDRRAGRARVGVALGEERGLSPRLSARENLLFFARLYGLQEAAARARVEELGVRLEATALLDQPVRILSTGQRARLGLLRALLHAPPVLLLDEMTRSLDPGVAARIRTEVAAEASRGTAVLFASHDLQEVRTLAQRVLVLRQGRAQAWGSFLEVQAMAAEVFA